MAAALLPLNVKQPRVTFCLHFRIFRVLFENVTSAGEEPEPERARLCFRIKDKSNKDEDFSRG